MPTKGQSRVIVIACIEFFSWNSTRSIIQATFEGAGKYRTKKLTLFAKQVLMLI
ncbi:MAG: hypothetical protein ACJAXN_002376 [Psychromonas sp.]|jgi:hypothetical protein